MVLCLDYGSLNVRDKAPTAGQLWLRAHLLVKRLAKPAWFPYAARWMVQFRNFTFYINMTKIGYITDEKVRMIDA